MKRVSIRVNPYLVWLWAVCSVVGVVGALTSMTSCAIKRHTAVVIDQTLYESLNDVHVVEQQALCGQPSCAGVTVRVTNGWTDVKSQNFNRKLLPAVDAGRQLNVLLGQWQPGTPPPAQLHNLITSLSDSLAAITADFPDGATKNKVLEDIGKAESIALTALDVVLTAKGGK